LFELIKKLQFYSSAIGEFFHNVAKNAWNKYMIVFPILKFMYWNEFHLSKIGKTIFSILLSE
jgi:hypothetical protein